MPVNRNDPVPVTARDRIEHGLPVRKDKLIVWRGKLLAECSRKELVECVYWFYCDRKDAEVRMCRALTRARDHG